MNQKVYNGILIGILVISLGLLFFANASAITGHAVTQTTSSNVSIIYFYAIDPSAELTSGIIFEPVSALPMWNDNATQNYAGASSSTLYYINISTNSNTNVTFCLRANANLTDSSNGEEIPLPGETYSTNVTSSDIVTPDMANDVNMTTTYVEAATNVGIGEVSYWRFWLDIPSGQAAGNYNNTVSFAAIDAENENCPA